MIKIGVKAKEREIHVGTLAQIDVSSMALVLISAGILCSGLLAYVPIHIWYFDAAEYVYKASTYFSRIDIPLGWMIHEGRWVNSLLFPILARLNGKLLLFLGFLLFFLFLFIAARRYTQNNVHAFLFAALCLQAPPWVHQTIDPWVYFISTICLLSAALTVRRLSIYVFYVIFGCLLSGTIQSFYYLLPLCHLPLISSPNFKANMHTLAVRIMPAWIGGLIVGWICSLVVIGCYTYLVMGSPQFGVEISEWRRVDTDNIVATIFRSAEIFFYHIEIFTLLVHPWVVAVVVGALAVGAVTAFRSFPVQLLFASIVLAHYVVIITLGVIFSFRTALPAAIGLAAFVFLWPAKSRSKYIIQVLMLCMSASWNIQSTQALHWQATVANTYHDELLRVVPIAPRLYTGVVLVNDSTHVNEVTRSIQKHFGIVNRFGVRPISLIHDLRTWRPVAFEIGFKDVWLCGDNETWHYTRSTICQDVARMISLDTSTRTIAADTTTFYTVLGELDGYLVISLNPKWSSWAR